MNELQVAERYRRMLGEADPLIRELARRQLGRLGAGRLRASMPAARSRWAHVPLADLFAEQGNRLHRRGDGRTETGHEPIHASRSGRCVLIDEPLGRWWCRSCRRSGDAARLVMDLRGCTYRQTRVWLATRYGPPVEPPIHGSGHVGRVRA